MTDFIIKDGKYSILLGYGYFGEFIIDTKMQINPLLLNNEKLEKNIENINNVENKLIKITFDNSYHTDDILEVIYSLQNYEKYICNINSNVLSSCLCRNKCRNKKRDSSSGNRSSCFPSGPRRWGNSTF